VLLRRFAAASLIVLSLSAHSAAAGQFRVDAISSPNTIFSPATVNINNGDYVVWVWIPSLGHSVTSGDIGTGTPDGTFASNAGTGGITNARFAWKSTAIGSQEYFCTPHWPDMVGTIIVHDPGPVTRVPVANFRITEVLYTATSGLDLIEITNFGDGAGDLATFRLLTSNGSVLGAGLSGPTASPRNIPVPSGGRVTIHVNSTGTNTNTDVFTTAITDLATSGFVALYIPNTTTGGTMPASTTDANQILDFVQWGASTPANETTAIAATFWGAGSFVPQTAAGHSIAFCPSVAGLDPAHGALQWAEINPPDIGTTNNCANPVRTTTWGAVKTIYR
jgi:plastocyanin